MVRIENAIDELRTIISETGPLDQPYCRRLVLRATSQMSDVQKAGELIDQLNTLLYLVELAPIIGDNPAYHVDQISLILDEIKNLSHIN